MSVSVSVSVSISVSLSVSLSLSVYVSVSLSMCARERECLEDGVGAGKGVELGVEAIEHVRDLVEGLGFRD